MPRSGAVAPFRVSDDCPRSYKPIGSDCAIRWSRRSRATGPRGMDKCVAGHRPGACASRVRLPVDGDATGLDLERLDDLWLRLARPAGGGLCSLAPPGTLLRRSSELESDRHRGLSRLRRSMARLRS